MTNQKPTKTKVERIRTLLRLMTPIEGAKFKEYVHMTQQKPIETRMGRMQTLLGSMMMTE